MRLRMKLNCTGSLSLCYCIWLNDCVDIMTWRKRRPPSSAFTSHTSDKCASDPLQGATRLHFNAGPTCEYLHPRFPCWHLRLHRLLRVSRFWLYTIFRIKVVIIEINLTVFLLLCVYTNLHCFPIILCFPYASDILGWSFLSMIIF